MKRISTVFLLGCALLFAAQCGGTPEAESVQISQRVKVVDITEGETTTNEIRQKTILLFLLKSHPA